eukprot:g16071.t1
MTLPLGLSEVKLTDMQKRIKQLQKLVKKERAGKAKAEAEVTRLARELSKSPVKRGSRRGGGGGGDEEVRGDDEDGELKVTKEQGEEEEEWPSSSSCS